MLPDPFFLSSRSLLARLVAPLVLVGLLACGLVPTAEAQSPSPVSTIKNKDGEVVLQSNADGGLLAPGTIDFGAIPAKGQGTRLMWHPAKAAFRAGQVRGSQWDANNIGNNSVALGINTTASGNSSLAMGDGTTASGGGAMAMGSETTANGILATAMGDGTTASGLGATAIGKNTTASGDYSVAMGDLSTVASGAVATAMGHGTTAATAYSLSIGRANNSNRTSDNTLFVAGNGVLAEPSDALVLKKDGDLSIDGDFRPGPTDNTFAGDFVASKAGVARDNPSRNVVRIRNTHGGDGPDVLALQSGPSNPGPELNYITFYDGSGTSVGAVEGNNGGVNYKTSGADFAEEVPVVEGQSRPQPAELVGMHGGQASLQTENADRVMIASSHPAMTGNSYSEAEATRHVEVAFIGQVPAKVRGEANVGDLIVASGRADGTARAVSPSEYRRSEHGPIAGQAWSAKSTSKVGTVTVVVGLGHSGAVAERLQAQKGRIDELEQRLAALETQVSSSTAVAGLSGPWLLLVLFALGGGLGAGLLWRRR